MSSIALCIPAYNAEHHLPRLLNSAAAQEQPFDQIWVYNDCSRDNTSAVAREFGAQVVDGAVNVGCSAGKDELLRRIDTDFVHFHDADDELLPEFVTTAKDWMDRASCPDVVLFAYEYRDDATNELLNVRRFDDASLTTDPIEYCIREQVNPFCGLYRREALLAAGGYTMPPEHLLNEDVAFHCRLAREGLSFRADEAVTVINYRMAQSMSRAAQGGCVDAQYAVMRDMAQHVGHSHGEAIAARLWRIASVAASLDRVATATQAAREAARLSDSGPGDGHRWYRWFARRRPALAVHWRERVIRWLGRRS